jgi:hypothetical protein
MLFSFDSSSKKPDIISKRVSEIIWKSNLFLRLFLYLNYELYNMI